MYRAVVYFKRNLVVLSSERRFRSLYAQTIQKSPSLDVALSVSDDIPVASVGWSSVAS